MFLKYSAKKRAIYIYIYIFWLTEILENQYLFEILQISFTFKNNKNVEKSGCFEKRLRWKVPIFYEITEGYKVS